MALAIATIIFLRSVVLPLAPGDVLDGNDLRAMFYPLHQYILQALQSGELPLWNPHQFIGHPVIGHPHSALFYPATWFMWLVTGFQHSAPEERKKLLRPAIRMQPYNRPDFKLIGIAPGGIYYERSDALGHAWFAGSITVEPNDDAVREDMGKSTVPTQAYVDHAITCPTSASGTATITDYRPNDVSIQTLGPGGLLVLSDQFYPGWQALVDGQATEIYRTDTTFRGVCVPTGDHTLTFQFRPMALYVGVVISAVGWLLVLALAITGIRKKIERTETPV